MPPTIKDSAALQKMRTSGRLTREVLEMITPYVVVGVTTGELDQICHDYIVDQLDAGPARLN